MSVSELFMVRGQAFNSGFFSGRGGGFSFIVNNNNPVDAVMFEAEFLENAAVAFGGGAFLLLQGQTAHAVTVNQSRFEGNEASSTSGGLHATFLLLRFNEESHQLMVHNCIFNRNDATYGGAVYFLVLEVLAASADNNARLGSYGRFENCTFSRNSATEAGGALGVAFNRPLLSQELTDPVDIVDCEFLSNTVQGAGIVTTAFFPITFSGNNRFSRSTGPSLAVIGSLVRVQGQLQISRSTNINSLDGGSLYFTSLGQIELQDDTRVVLMDNIGVVGAAVVIQNIELSNIYSQLRYNTLCSFQFRDRVLPPNRWRRHNVSVEIVGNKAIVASGVSLNNIDFCSWSRNSYPYFDSGDVFRWNYISYRSNRNSAHGDPINDTFVVQTPAVRLILRDRLDKVNAFPGERVEIGILALDEFGLATYAVVGIGDDSQMSTSEKSMDKEVYQFSPSSVSLTKVSRSAVEVVKFGVSGDDDDFPEEDIRVRTLGSYFTSSDTMFTLTPSTCPAGYILDPGAFRGDFSSCACDSGSFGIVECNDRLITMEDLRWGYTSIIDGDFQTVTRSRNFMGDFFYIALCPREYCNCRIDNSLGISRCVFVYDSKSPESQCHCNREGLLCGDCVNGTGFSTLLNKCVECDDRFSIFILVLVVINVAVVLTILLLMLPIPAWVYPTIFYLQILPTFTEYFPFSFERLGPYLEYISSALGLYFPYDFCLHSDMPATGVYALRYIPSLVATAITPIFLYFRSRKSRSIDWHGVWLLIILLSTPVLHTSVKLLDCPHLEGERPFTPRWFVNANVKCFQDAGHTPLGLFALAVLVGSVALTVLLVLIATQRLTKPLWVRHMVVPLTLRFKKSRSWWCGVELGKRLVLVVFAVAVKGNVVTLALIFSILLCLNGYFKPFKSFLVNILDMVYTFIVFVLLCLRSTPDIEFNLRGMVRETSDSLDCATKIEFSSFVIILGVLYYLPLVIAVLTLLFYFGWLLLSCIKKDVVAMIEKKDLEEPVDDLSASVKNSTEKKRTRTQTFVDISSCEPSTPVAVPREQFSFKFKKPSIRLGSRKHKKKDGEEKNSFSPGLQDIPMEDLHNIDEVKVELEDAAVTDLDLPSQ